MGWFTSVRSTITCTPCSPAQAPSCGNSPPGIMWRVFPGGGQRSGLRRFIRQQCLCPARRHRRQAVAIHHRELCGVSSPAVVNGVVYVGSYDNNVYALNAGTGAMLWQFTTGGSVDSSPAVSNGLVSVLAFRA